MKLGCFGCLLLVVTLLVLVVVVLGVVFLSTNIFDAPKIAPPSFSRNDGYSAQQKLYEVASRQAGRSTRRDPIVLTQGEVNAFLSKHLDQAGLPLSPLAVRFTKGQLVAQGRTTFRHLLKGPPLAQLSPYITDKRLDEPVWVTVQGDVKVSGTGSARRGSLEVSQFALGTQHLGSMLLYLLLGPSGGGLLQWPVPAVVDEVRIGDGQLFIVTK
jgi:hypothetical protein